MRHSARHLAASALALLALGAGLQLSDSMLPSGTVLAMGGKPDVQTQQTAQTGRLGSVAPQPALGGVGMADGQFGGAGEAGKEPARSGVFGSAFTGAVRGLLSGMPAWMQALGEASAPGAGLRGMGTMGSMSGMGDMTSAAGAIADPMAGASQNAKLLGTWAAPNGMSPLTIQLRKGGACTLFDKGQQVAGSWETAGDIIRLRFANGRTFALSFSVEGDYLALSDGSCLQRQPEASFPAPQASTDPQDLLGSWRAWNGSYAVVLTLVPKTCVLNANAKEFKGRWKARKGWLHVDFESGPPLDAGFIVEGNVLRLGDGTLLLRQ